MKRGVVGGFGPFDTEGPLKPTEYGGGAGLIEGSPLSQTGKLGASSAEGVAAQDHLTGGNMSVAEKIGVVYRVAPTDETAVDPATGLSVDALPE